MLEGHLFKAPGFEFLSAPVLIDAHFFARGLMGRHLFALARDKLPAGVGIDEDAAVLISSDQQTWRVIGRRARRPDLHAAGCIDGRSSKVSGWRCWCRAMSSTL